MITPRMYLVKAQHQEKQAPSAAGDKSHPETYTHQATPAEPSPESSLWESVEEFLFLALRLLLRGLTLSAYTIASAMISEASDFEGSSLEARDSKPSSLKAISPESH
jgi:hypothetical protein